MPDKVPALKSHVCAGDADVLSQDIHKEGAAAGGISRNRGS
jgi:hypothetical protein